MTPRGLCSRGSSFIVIRFKSWVNALNLSLIHNQIIPKVFVMKHISSAILVLCIVLYSSGALAQSEKNEVEDSIPRDEMPAKALETLDHFWPDLDDIRYYFQTDGDSETFEAKLEWQLKNYSIEFTQDGRIIDIEQLMGIDEIYPEARRGIEEYLQQKFKRVRITRLQQQFIADDDDEVDDIDFIDDILEKDEDDYIVRFELEVEGRSGSQIGAFELLFDRSGDILRRREIFRRSVDNIW